MSKHKNQRTLPILGLLLLAGLIVSLGIHKQAPSLPAHWKTGWQALSPFHFPRRALAAVTSNGYLYVIGGVDAQDHYVRPVEFARILADGRLGPWQITQPLKVGRFYLAAEAQGGYLYALGGGGGELGDNNMPLASVERAKINPDGSLQAWQQHSYLTTPRRGLKTAVINGKLYAIGGYNGQFLKSSEFIDLNEQIPDAQWHQITEEAKIDRYIHAAANIGPRIFLLGGHVEKGGPMSYGDVESTTIEDSGQLAPWEIAPSHLLTPRFIASAFALGDYLYIVGGHDGVRRLASVEMAHVNRRGQLSTWSPLNSLNHKRSATATATNGQYVYIAGGMDDRGVLNSVEMAQSGPRGQLGYIESPQSPAGR